MTEKQKQIIQTFSRVIPRMTEMEQERLLGYGEGIACKIEKMEQAQVIELVTGLLKKEGE